MYIKNSKMHIQMSRWNACEVGVFCLTVEESKERGIKTGSDVCLWSGRPGHQSLVLIILHSLANQLKEL